MKADTEPGTGVVHNSAGTSANDNICWVEPGPAVAVFTVRTNATGGGEKEERRTETENAVGWRSSS